jgi:hypothetical protein
VLERIASAVVVLLIDQVLREREFVVHGPDGVGEDGLIDEGSLEHLDQYVTGSLVVLRLDLGLCFLQCLLGLTDVDAEGEPNDSSIRFVDLGTLFLARTSWRNSL